MKSNYGCKIYMSAVLNGGDFQMLFCDISIAISIVKVSVPSAGIAVWYCIATLQTVFTPTCVRRGF